MLESATPPKRPVIWTIAGSDSGAGAGLQADLKTAEALDVHACTVVTATTAQNTQRVAQVTPVSAAELVAQLDALSEDLPPQAIKLGLLPNAEMIRTLAEYLPRLKVPVVCDPVLVASSQDRLTAPDCVAAFTKLLFPICAIVTPNLEEAATLTGRALNGPRDIADAGQDFLRSGASAVLIKGGHADGAEVSDYFVAKEGELWLSSPRLAGEFHGTGCTLSSAIACGLAGGLSLIDAVVRARAFITAAMTDAYRPGQGFPILRFSRWPAAQARLPSVVGESRQALTASPPMAEIGFYPIVPSAAWVKRLLALGVKTIQLRLKNLPRAVVHSEIAEAVLAARSHSAELFINDYWREAIEYRAFGVHLGQEDLVGADLTAIKAAGLRLGISTHSYEEAARAHAVKPSYVALGPILPTTCKSMRFGPQGFQKITEWKTLLPYPIVAIGGLKLEHAEELAAAKPHGVAVISDVTENAQPEERASRWLAFTREFLCR